MTVQMVLSKLHAAGVRLRNADGQLVVAGQRDRVDGALLEALRGHKVAILELLAAQGGDWWTPPPVITPEMLPLVELTQAEIDRIVAGVPGGTRNVQDIYPLAPLQEGILFHHLMANEGDPYLLASITSFDTRGRLQAYLDALQAVADRHDILRTAFVWEGLNEPVQVVWRTAPLPVEELALDPADGDVAAQLHARFHPRRHRIDLSRAPLLRLYLAYDAANERWVLLQLMHHLLDDNTSLRVLHGEIRAHLEGRAHELPAPLPFRNYVAQARLGVSREAHEAYFRTLLGDVDEPAAPFGLLDAWGDGSGLEEAKVTVDGPLAQRLRARTQALGVGAASLFHLAWAQVLAQVSGRDDVVFGTVLFGRMQGGEGAHRVIGPFINTLPVRVRLDAGVEAGVRAMHRQLAELLVHEHASLALAQRCSGVRAPAPLFTSLLNYRQGGRGRKEEAAPAPAPNAGPRAVQRLFSEERTNYPVTLSVNDGGEGGFTLQAQTPASVGAERVCAMVHRALQGLVEALEEQPDLSVRRVEVLPEAERRLVVQEWNAPGAAYAADECVHALFETQVARTPGAVAVSFEEGTLTYAELNARANRLAHHLRGRGVGPDGRVALCVERSLEMVVGLLAVLKAGGGYVPLDPGYPEERIRYTLGDAGPALLLTQASLRGRFADVDVPVLALDDDAASWADLPETNPEAGVRPHHLAYVIYTSGSTGQPKGVMVEHRNVARLFSATDAWFGFGPDDVWTLFHSFAFDFSVWEIWGALLYGGRLVVVPRETARSPEEFYALLCREGVTVLNQTPSAFRQLIAAQAASGAEHALRYVVFGGEALELATLRPWFARNDDRRTTLVNMYGITETTVHVTYRPLVAADAERAGPSPIGVRIPDLQTYVLDPLGQPAPIGVTGELYVGGAGVARGYLNRPELTAQRFVRDPFSADPDARLYRTGDLGRWLADGTLEYLGRNDFQVKIRGFRIELGEIEARLLEQPGVREAVVIAREDAPGDRRLVAYVVGDEGEADALRAQLSARLPEHMVPAAFVRLERLPLTPNGKLDRNALPAPDADAFAARAYEPPLGDTEVALAEVWAELLGRERIGRHDDFFALGGHSLLAVRIVSRVRQALGAQVSIGDLFVHPVLADFARVMDESARAGLPPIERADREGPLPLSFAQQRLWFLERMGGLGDTYHIPRRMRLGGELDRGALRRALDALLARHEALRTTFVEVDGEPVQRIAPPAAFPLGEHDLAGHPEADAELRRLAAEELGAPFDLEHGPLFRGRLVRLAADEHVLLLTLHHIVSDGWSMEVLTRELGTLYDAFRRGDANPLAPLPLQYADYAAWQRRWVAGEVLQRQADYWKRTLSGAPGLLELPTDHARPAVQDHAGGTVPVELDEALTAGLKALGRRHGTTLFMTLLAGWAAVLGRLSGQADVVVGTPSANRGRREIEGLIGFFVSTLAVRVDLSGSPRVGELLARVKERALGAQHHQDIPFEQVVELLQPERSLSHTPLFQVMFTWQTASEPAASGLAPAPAASAPRPASAPQPGAGGQATAKFDLSLALAERDGRITGSVGYATALFERETVERFVACLGQALEAMAADEGRPVDRLPLLPDAERRRVLEAWNATQAAYPRGACVHELVRAQAARTPDAVALSCRGERVTYGEMQARANQLAHALRRRGVGPEVRVGLCLPRTPDLLVAMLGVLGAGGAYVPLDPAYPRERLGWMLQDAGIGLVITDSTLADRLPADASALLLLDRERGALAAEPMDAPESGAVPENLSHVIFTSGSTGRPKGVMIRHSSVEVLLHWLRDHVTDAERASVLFSTSINFDVSVAEIFGTLAWGGKLVIVENALELAGLDEEVVHVSMVPSAAEELLRGGGIPACVRTLNLAGEALPNALAQGLYALGTVEKVGNLYGPTEDTTYSTYSLVPRGAERVLVGSPLANTQAYVLDAHLQPAPVGVAGELYLAGDGLSRGYVSRPGMTAERFLPCPFGPPGSRMYRVMDRVRRRADGQLEYLGRTDFQVKVRGFRIELGEIEARLAEHAGVRAPVAVVREDAPGDPRLVAYYLADAPVPVDALKAHLADRLPAYMLPAAYVCLDAYPQTPNGKVDRKALPAPDGLAYAAQGYEAPATESEAALAEIWAEVLGVERVGRGDHFFERGGHSLLAVRVASRVRQVLGADLPLGELFRSPVLADFARAVDDAGRAGLPAIEPADRDRPLPLSFSQQRLWFLERMGGLGDTYHIPRRMRLRGELDRDALVRALDAILARHEALRTTFAEVDGEPVQRICGESRFHLVEHDLEGHPEGVAELRRLAAEEAGAPFDLRHGPLVRGRLVRLAADDHVLLLTLHHVVSDGWSMGVLTRELGTLYGAFRRGDANPLAPLPLQYADYAAWQRRWVDGEVLQAQADYWKAALGGAPALLELPTDRPRPARQDHAGGVVGLELDEALTAGLKALARRHGTTLFMTLLAGWATVLGRLSGQADVVVGTPSANRGRREIEGLIGFFVNTLALRVDLSGAPRVGELLARVRERALGAQQHQDIPFEQVVELVQPARSLAHTPLFQVMFTWVNAAGEGTGLPGLELAPLGSAPRPGTAAEQQVTAKFDLSLGLSERGGRITGSVEYATALFDRGTVERYLGYLRRVLEGMAADDRQSVDALELLPEAERRLVVEEWNATEAAYPADACIHGLFETQVERTPDAVAVSFQGESLTYAELNRRANRLAHHLRALGVGPDARVGLCLQRGPEMMVGLLATLKAGGAYVPLDPEYPADRLAYMLQDSAPVVLLTQGALREQLDGVLAGAPVPVLELDAPAPAWADRPETDPRVEGLGPRHLAYVIYTSGSTGRPKGVANEHGGVVNRLAWMRDVHGLGADETVLQKTPYSFDVSVWELFWPLVSGARLVMARPGGHKDPGYLAGTIVAEEVTTTHFVPSMLQAFLEHPDAGRCTGLRRVVCSGEALPAALVQRFHERLPGVELHNLYGPTEAAVDVTVWHCRAEDAGMRIPIGRPVANTRMYVLDREGAPVPMGVAGELYIGGVQVARGYPGRPELTAERFVADPFGGEPGARLYRTGDLGRWLPDGSIEYLGRNDFQVKIRGFRIELGEIEARLRGHPDLREAVVVARADGDGGQRLVAYYLADEPVAVDALKAHLAEGLPAHMVPAAYVHLAALPLTASGKLDRKALPAPEGDAFARRGYEAPVGETEQALAEIWAGLLGVERVGRRDDFFELGGHSLLIVKLIERMRRRGLHAEVGTLFTTPVLAELAEALTGEALDVIVPPNAIPADARAITPEMLSLVRLGQADIDRIVAGVDGGAANVQDIYPLAPLQEGILFHHLLKGDADPYVMPSLYRFAVREELDAYLGALQAVIDRHDILRTSIAWEGLPEPVQVVWRRARLAVEEVELDAAEADASQALWARFDPRHIRLDIGRAPVMRACVAHDAAHGRWLLLLQRHHLISDHTTLEVLHEEMRFVRQGREAELPAPLPFRNYVAQARLGVSPDEHRAFFRELLADVDEPTAPFGVLDVRGDGSGMREARLDVDERLAVRLRERARTLGVSAASIAHVAWAQVLARATGRDDVVFGTLLFGRMHGGEGADRVMGPFINTLPVRVRLGQAGVAATVREAHVLLAKLLRHEHASLALAQQCSGVEAPAPLFTALLNYRHSGGGARARAASAPKAEGMRTVLGEERTNYPLALTVDDLGGGFRLKGQVTHASLDPHRLCGFMHRALEALVEALETAPGRAAGGIDVLPADERARVVDAWNGTAAAYPGASFIHRMFETQAERTPHAVALSFEGGSLTYTELNARANQLAHHLRALGVGPDARVAVCVERGPEMLAGLLAILKAGGGYVPLDPAYPEERLRYMLADSGPVALLTQGALADRFDGLEVPVVALDVDAPAWADRPRTNPEPAGLTPGHLAYVIYTSGSTGAPKGVMVEHRAIANHTAWQCAAFGIGPRDTVLQRTSISFDASVWELWTPLAAGARMLLLPPAAGRDPRAIGEVLRRGGVTVAQFVPALLQAVLDELPEGARLPCRAVFCGGDALPARLVAQARARGVGQVVNLYGPTEATIDTTFHVCRDGDGEPPIGAPVGNARVYVLDRAGKPVPVGVAGELYVGGAGLARGYRGRPALTAERFVPDPFGGEPGARLYRTGDLARWLPDGTLAFLGRTDFQVKVRGFRIELGEIEARLAEHAGVREAVVLAREDRPGEKRLVAYVAGDETAGADALRAHLGETLPEHMVPAAVVRLERLPLTPNGKLDRKALPAPEDDGSARRGYAAPVGEVEQAIAEIWAELLGVERVGRWDHFFELGGHSLFAVRLLSRVRQRLDVEVGLDAVFQRPVLADFARALRDDAADEAAAGSSGAADLPVPVRAAGSQRPLFLLHDGRGSVDYAQVLAWQVDPEIPVYALPPRLDGGGTLPTLQDMGARFARMIQSVQPAGPYRLAGHSLGGILAYETAAQLVARGEAVEFLGLFDTTYSNASQGVLPQQLGLEETFRFACQREGKEGWSEATFQALVSRPELSDLGSLVRAGCEAGLFPPLPPEQVSLMQQKWWAWPRALGAYTPPALPVTVSYFEAMESAGTGVSGLWQAFLTETSFRKITVPGAHASIMEPDHVPILGQAVSREIARATLNGSRPDAAAAIPLSAIHTATGCTA